MRSPGGCTETENPLTSVSGFFLWPATNCRADTGVWTAAGLAETRRKYIPVGLCDASLRPIVLEQTVASHVYAGRFGNLWMTVHGTCSLIESHRQVRRDAITAAVQVGRGPLYATVCVRSEPYSSALAA